MTKPLPDAFADHSAGTVLDEQALDKLRQLDPGGHGRLLWRVLQAYRASMKRLLEQLDLAQGRSDAATMGLVVHTLKSSSASVGALDLSQLCARAEQALREGRLDDAEGVLLDLRTECVRVGRAVAQLLDDPA